MLPESQNPRSPQSFSDTVTRLIPLGSSQGVLGLHFAFSIARKTVASGGFEAQAMFCWKKLYSCFMMCLSVVSIAISRVPTSPEPNIKLCEPERAI